MQTLFNSDSFLTADLTFKVGKEPNYEEIQCKFSFTRRRPGGESENWGVASSSPKYNAYTGTPLDQRIGVGAIGEGMRSDGRKVKLKILEIIPPGFKIVSSAIGDSLVIEFLDYGVSE